MSRPISIFLCLFFLLAACGPASTPAPMPTLTPTATSTPEPSATEIPLLSYMPPDFYAAFNAIPNVGPIEGFFRVENDQLFITVGDQSIEISQDGQFGVNIDSSGRPINNPLASLSVVGTDRVTYGFNPETQVWFNTSEFHGSEDIDNPTVIDAARVFDGTLTRALLLDPEVNTPFPEGTIYGQNIVGFHSANINGQFPEDYYIYLENLANRDPSATSENINIKMVDQHFRVVFPAGTTLRDGTVTDTDYSFDFQPQKIGNYTDLSHPDPSNFSLLLLARGESRSNLFQNNGYESMLAKGNIPIPVLVWSGGYSTGSIPDSLARDPSVAILQNIPGNGIDQMGYFEPNIIADIPQMVPEGDISFTAVNGIPPNLQKMLFSFFMANWLEK
jgi:hypothetical protein